MKRKITFIVNPKSGTNNKEEIVKLIPETIDSSRYEWRLKYVEREGHCEELARDAVRRHADAVVAVGGDGTVNGVACGLVGTDTALGIVPCGSGNGLARHLQLPMDAEKALQVINDMQIIRADHCKINDHLFFCTCGVGFDAYVSDRFAKAGKRGMWTYMEQMVNIAREYDSEDYELEIDGEKMSVNAFLITCGNASQYGNNVFIAPEASLTDGYIDAIVMLPFKKIHSGRVIYQMLNRTITDRKNVHLYRCKHIVIKRQAPGVIHCDGDPFDEEAVLDISIVPSSISMICGNRNLYSNNALTNAFNEISDKIGSDIRSNNRRIMRINKELLGLLKK
ncbi:MAG: diacylglycerol kinase family lipid kinase [Bacteroidaceae bacterium]|nr:diacylglycerol kinase family lipid kinase [Bacteroidaceae bacterium]